MRTLRFSWLVALPLLWCYDAPKIALRAVAPPEEGLVAHFSFNQCDARDVLGSASFGEFRGPVRCWCGIDGDGLLLDGETAHVIFEGPVNRYFNTSDFTISFYFKPEARSAFPLSILSKRARCDEYQMLDLMLDFNRPELTTYFHESPNKYFLGLSPEVKPAGWQHFALVREGLYAYAYINGERVRESFRCSGVDIGNEAPLSIANSPCVQTGRARRFRGLFDELRVYDRALGPEEVKALYERYPIENPMMDCVL
jgi:hypothetical protein